MGVDELRALDRELAVQVYKCRLLDSGIGRANGQGCNEHQYAWPHTMSPSINKQEPNSHKSSCPYTQIQGGIAI